MTKEDYLTHLFSLPEKFGRIDKAYVNASQFNPYAVDIHVLTLDANGKLTRPTVTLQENIKLYFDKIRMLTEGVNILPANIVNVGINFGVVISTQYSRAEVMTACLVQLKEYLKTSNMSIGSPLVISDMVSMLQNLTGVISVYKFDVVSHFGINPDTNLSYSEDISFDVSGSTKNGIVMCPKGSTFEVKYPDMDIIGESK